MFDFGAFFKIGSVSDAIALAAGIIAMIFCIGAFQAKNRKTILVMQMVGMGMWAVHFAIKGNYAGSAMNGLAVLRALVYVQRNRRAWADSKLIPAAFICIFAVSGAATYFWGGDTMWYLPVVAMTVTSVGLFCKNEQTVRVINLFSSPPWIIYNAVAQSAPAVFTETFTMVSVIIALVRYRRTK